MLLACYVGGSLCDRLNTGSEESYNVCVQAFVCPIVCDVETSTFMVASKIIHTGFARDCASSVLVCKS